MVMNPNPIDLNSAIADASFEPVCPNCGCIILSDENGTWCNCNETKTVKPIVEPTVPETKETKEEVVEPKQVMPSDILKTLPGAPSPEQIANWKKQFGSVYVLPLSMTELYVWRPLSRREWQSMQMNEALAKDETKLQEHVVMRAVLWPKIGPIELNISRAGVIPSLFGVIMHGSYFLPLEMILQNTEEL